MKLLSEKQQACTFLFSSLQTQLTYITDTYSCLKQITVDNTIDMKKGTECAIQSQIKLNNLTDTWNHLTSQMVNMRNKLKELNEIWTREDILADTISSAQPRAKFFCQKIRESWQTLNKDKNSRVLSVNEDQLHQLEKIKIENNCKKLSDLLYNSCYQCLNEMTEKLEDWYARAQVAIVLSQCLFRELSDFMSSCEELQHSFNIMKEDQQGLWKEILASRHHSNHNEVNSSESGLGDHLPSDMVNANFNSTSTFNGKMPVKLAKE